MVAAAAECGGHRPRSEFETVKPDFVILGAFKAGTTSLHQYFAQHPKVFMTAVKEPNFFAFDPGNRVHQSRPQDFPVRTWEDYQRLFEQAPMGACCGDASPAYLHSKIAPARLREQLPNARLIVSLRAPVDRAYSHFQMAVRSGRAATPSLPAVPTDAMWFSASLYSESLARYFELFGRDQVRVVLFEDLSRRPADVMRQLFEFVGVDPLVQVDTGYGHNPGGLPRHPRLYRAMQSLRNVPGLVAMTPVPVRRLYAQWRDRGLVRAPALPPEVRDSWQEYYRVDIQRTAELTGLDLSHWL